MLRTVPVTPDDESFLFQVYASSRVEEMRAWGWSSIEVEAFLRMQFHAQRQSYDWQFPDADHRIIERDGVRIGRLIVERNDQEMRLVDITLLPEARNGGIGHELIRALQAEAQASGKPLGLRVLKTNPARRLYQRLNFIVVGEDDLSYQMEWRPTPDQEAQP